MYFVSAVCWDNEGHLVATGDNKGHLKVKASSTIYKKKNRKLLIMFTKYIHVYTMPREDVWSNLKRKKTKIKIKTPASSIYQAFTVREHIVFCIYI